MHWTVSNYVFGKITIEIPTQKQLIATNVLKMDELDYFKTVTEIIIRWT